MRGHIVSLSGLSSIFGVHTKGYSLTETDGVVYHQSIENKIREINNLKVYETASI